MHSCLLLIIKAMSHFQSTHIHYFAVSFKFEDFMDGLIILYKLLVARLGRKLQVGVCQRYNLSEGI